MALISINGPDNIGKTTQIKLLPENINKLGSIEIQEMPQENSSNWWFKECSTPKFTKLIVESIQNRMKKIKEGINIFDRGTLIFKAVCVATAAIKDSQTIEESYENVNRDFLEVPKEELQIFLSYSDSNSIQEMQSREKKIWTEDYIDYQKNLRKAIDYVIKLEPENIIEIECQGKSVIEIQNEIRTIISKHATSHIFGNEFRPILKSIDFIFGIGGLSESGKSFTGQYLRENHSFIPLKKIYFDEINSIINGKSIFDETAEDESRFTILELDRFCKANYYFKYISIESLRNYEVTNEMKKMLGKKFVVIYLEVDREKRLGRGSEEEQKMFINKENLKKSKGADDIKTMADYIVLNNEELDQLKLAIDSIVISEKKKY